jgi:hypothetical protein
MSLRFLVSYCDVCCDFRIETMFGSSLPPVVCRRVHVLFTLFVHVQCILCCVVVLFVFVLYTLRCQFHWIPHLWLLHRYFLTFIWYRSRINIFKLTFSVVTFIFLLWNVYIKMIAKDTNPKQITFDIYLHPFGSWRKLPFRVGKTLVLQIVFIYGSNNNSNS